MSRVSFSTPAQNFFISRSRIVSLFFRLTEALSEFLPLFATLRIDDARLTTEENFYDLQPRFFATFCLSVPKPKLASDLIRPQNKKKETSSPFSCLKLVINSLNYKSHKSPTLLFSFPRTTNLMPIRGKKSCNKFHLPI